MIHDINGNTVTVDLTTKPVGKVLTKEEADKLKKKLEAKKDKIVRK